MAKAKYPRTKAKRPDPYLIKGLTWRAILALLDVQEKYFEDDSFTQSLTTMNALERRGLVILQIAYDRDEYRRVRAKLTKKGESRIAACVYEYQNAQAFLKAIHALKKAA